jgi:hypothetical protein
MQHSTSSVIAIATCSSSITKRIALTYIVYLLHKCLKIYTLLVHRTFYADAVTKRLAAVWAVDRKPQFSPTARHYNDKYVPTPGNTTQQ